MADTDYPNQVHPLVKAMEPSVRLCRDLGEGTRAVHANSQRYIPQGEYERESDYVRRARSEPVFDAFGRSIEGLTGLVMQQPVELNDDANEDLRSHWEDIDQQGTKGSVFANRLLSDGFESGVVGILVDFPTVEEAAALSRAQERAIGARPYWCHVRREDVVTWRYDYSGGPPKLSLLVLQEVVEVPDGSFGIAFETRYRVFGRRMTTAGPVVEVELWKKGAGKDEQPERVAGSRRVITNQVEIPVALIPLGKPPQGNVMLTPPPLLSLAEVNIAHWVKSSELAWLAHLACVPIPVRKGYVAPADGREMMIGPALLQDLPTDGDFSWAEISGTALEPVAKLIEKHEHRMATLGMAFLMAETRAAETAEAKRLDASAQNASLAVCAESLEDGLNRALGFHARYLRTDLSTATVNTDFEQVVMAVADMAEYRAMQTGGQISLELYWDILEKGKRLPPEFDREAERRRLAEEGAALVANTAPAAKTDPAPADTTPSTTPPIPDDPQQQAA